MKELVAAFVLQAGELRLAECNRKEPFVHVQLPVASIVAVHLHVLPPAFSRLRLQEAVVAHVQVTATLLLREARALIRLRQEVAAVAGAAVRSVAEVAAAAVQVAVAEEAVVQADADNERDNISIV